MESILITQNINKIMRKNLSVLVVIFVLNWSCSSQEKSISEKLLDNWSPSNQEGLFEEYFETYFDGSKLHTYNGWFLNSNEYKLKDTKYFVYSMENKGFVEIGEVNIVQDTLLLQSKNRLIKYYRIKDENTLKEFVEGDIDKEQYHNSFNKRLLDW